MRFRILLLVFSCLLFSIKVNAQTASFNAPDTVCRGQNITINNTSTGQSTNLWNFCKQSPTSVITGINIGNLGVSQRPGYIQIYKDGTSYYGFVGNEQNGGAGLVRLNFGNSILNTPTSTVFSTFSGQLDGPKGMQFFNENGNWYAIIVADNWNAANDYVLVRLDFGNSLSNSPTITNFGDLGGVINEYISDVEIRRTSDGYIGFISSISGKLFRINFGNTITNTPTAVNLGVFGVAKPSIQISLLYRKNNWFLYFPKDDVTPANCSIGSLNFGTSLLNTPTYTNYGNPNSLLNRAYDFLPFVDCDNLKGYVLAPGANKIIEYSFPNDIYSTSITGRDIGNIATFNFPSAFSEPIIFNNEKYVFVTNQISNTISRLKLSNNCTSFGIASSTLTNPPVFHIDSVGTYNVSLVINENLATEARFCKEIVVIDSIKKPDARINTITCSTDSIRLTIANRDSTATYSWIGPNSFSSTRPNVSIKFSNANQAGQYIVTAIGRCGTKKDTVSFVSPTGIFVNIGKDTSICQGSSVTLNATTSGTTVTYLWNNGVVTPTISVNQAGTYFVKVTADGCSASDTIRVTILTPPTAFSIGNDTTYCGSFSRILSTGNASTVWSTGVTAAQITVTQPNTYIATITNSCGTKKDTIVIKQNNIPLINLGKDTSICQGNTVTLNATTSGTTVTYLWNNGAVTPTITVNQAGTYFVKVTADGCSASDTIRVTILTPPTAFSIGNDTTYCGSFSRILSTGNASTVWSTGVTAAQITVTQPNTYIATITNSCGTKKDTIVINQNNIPLINIGKDTSICQGSSVTLNATTSGTTVTYLWNNGVVTPTISVNQAGTYFVKVTADGCSASDTIRVTILTPPTAFSIGNDTTYCGSFPRILSTGNASTVWSTGVTAAQITVTQPNTYIATITNSCGTKKDTIVIKQNNIPLINLGKDTSICQGNSVTLNATTSGTTVTYLWNNGAVTPTITVNQAGTYFVKVTADGCSASDTIRVTILTPPTAFSIGNDTTYCGSFSRILSTGNANTVWSTGVTAAQITVTQPNTYFATISNSCGSESDSIVITQDEIPTVQINKDTMICGGQPILLTAITNASQFIWNTGETGNSITINQAGKYWVSVTNNTCTAVDTVYIMECEGDLWVPTAFSPNNDGVNDYFKIFGKNVLEYRLLVFDRWGEKLYESNDINISWDGVYKGEVVQLDSYAWVIEYKIILGGVAQNKMKKGTVTVFR
ncbi:MAG: gliding motility-associated C-terminal domain-containing protein [Saprospirales bacterium]|nr:gliding motility-associated C-terminal domain-containing protein [Saprospirales bacterium]